MIDHVSGTFKMRITTLRDSDIHIERFLDPLRPIGVSFASDAGERGAQFV